MLTKRS